MRLVKCRHQHPLAFAYPVANLVQKVVDLPLDRANLDLGIDQAGGADDLLDDHAGRFGQLVRSWCCGNINRLVHAILELFKGQRAVVQRARQAESVLDQRLFARAVAVPHAVQLRDGLVRLVDKNQEVAGNVVEQRGRRLAGQSAGKVPRVVLDAVAVAHLLDHLQVEARALVNALRLDDAALLFQFALPPGKLLKNGLDRRLL